MKVWIEFPKETRFARQERDVLYTPIYFANEKITAHLRLDKEWKSVHGDEFYRQFTGRVKLVGKASLGFLSVGGKPVNGIDTRYAIPSLGFKPIYTLEILNLYKRISLANMEYDAEDGVRGGRTPFSFQLPTSTLEDLQQLASSLKVITADNVSTMDFLQGMTPALIVNVQYSLAVEILDNENQVKTTTNEEIRIFVSLSEEQVPTADHQAVTTNPMAQFVRTQVVSMSSTRNRRGSIPLIRRLSRTSTQDTNLVTIDMESIEPFTFTRHSDAAASKAKITLIYNTDAASSSSSEPPPPLFASIQWMLKSLTTLTLEPMEGDTSESQADDYFHLRAKVLPSRKLKLKWSEWQRMPDSDTSRARWKSSQQIWLIKDITAGMTPTFVTPYLSHTYYLNMQISLVENEAKLGRGLTTSKQKVELDVPVQVRYDLGLVPSYEVDERLPEYDHTLPEYDEVAGAGEAVGAEAGEADELPDLSSLSLNLVETRESNDDGTLPIRQILHPHGQASTHGV